MKIQIIAIAAVACTSSFAHADPSGHNALAVMDSAIHSPDPETRMRAAEALGIAGSHSAFQSRLESMLKDRDVKVRLAAVQSLSETSDEAALRLALDDRAPEVRFSAAKALYAMGDPAAQPLLIQVLNGGAKTHSAFLVSEVRTAQHVLSAPKALEKVSIHGAINFAPLPGLRAGVSMTEKLMARCGTANRAATALLLGKSADSQAFHALEGALNDRKALVRAAAITGLAFSDNPEMAKYAEAMLNDKDKTVRLDADASYLRLTSTDPE